MILTLEQQVCSLGSAKRLKELGFSQKSLWFWCRGKFDGSQKESWELGFYDELHAPVIENLITEYVSAYTVAELGELMPRWAATFKATYPEGIRWTAEDGQSPEHKHNGNTEAEARAKMLIYLAENKLMEVSNG